MKNLRVALIGLGGRGGLGYYAHLPEDGVRVVAGADPDETALSFFRDSYSEAMFTSRRYQDVLATDVDAVVITSPPYLRAEHALAALRAGKAVFLDKPMAPSVEACDEILEAARETGQKLYVGNALRHTAMVTKLIELVDAGAVGAVKAVWCRHFVAEGGRNYFRDWHAEKARINGLLVQEGADTIDVLHRLCGSSAKRVNGVGALAVFRHDAEETDLPEENGTPGAEWPLVSREILNEVVDVEDISMMSMQLHNGTLATYQQCHFSPDTWHSFTVIGSRGRMENVGEDTGGAVIRVWNRPLPYFNPWGDEQHPIHRELQTHAEDSRMMAGFVAFLRGAETPVYTPVDARNAVAAADLATRSIRDQGDSFEIPRVDERVADFFGKP